MPIIIDSRTHSLYDNSRVRFIDNLAQSLEAGKETFMASYAEGFRDIPGTTVFDAAKSRHVLHVADEGGKSRRVQG